MANAYIQDNFAPTQAEHTVFNLEVSGTIPAHLDGRYLRNGPNPMSAVDPDTYHWFMGDGMVHGLRLRDGRAQWYRNRWVRTPEIARALGETLDTPRAGARRTWIRAEHQRHRARRPHVRPRRGGTTLPTNSTEELRHHRPVRLRRHAPGRLHGPPEARPADRRAARRLVLLGPGPTWWSTA